MVVNQGTLPEGRKFPCADMELNVAECLEAYGVVRGQEKCAKFLEDFKECRSEWLTQMRWYIMRQERMKKVAKGEIPFSERWGKPYPYDSFVAGGFAP